MLDMKGNLLTDKKAINKEAVNVSKEKWQNRKIKEVLEDTLKDRGKFAELNMTNAARKKTNPWNMEDLETVLNYLKKSKARDPYSLANKLFHPEVTGEDLKTATLKIFKRIGTLQYIFHIQTKRMQKQLLKQTRHIQSQHLQIHSG